jgi:hypothetical protein
MEENQEIQSPAELFPTKEPEKQLKEVEVKDAEKTKKQKTWGPVMPIRQSNRIDRSMNVMDKVKELKKKINLEVPASKKLSGIMRNNLFNLLQFDALGNMASTVGVKIGTSILDSSIDDDEVIDESLREEISTSNATLVTKDVEIVDVENDHISNDSMESLEQYNTAHDINDVDDDSWTKVYSRKWGKHPKKLFQC